MAPAQIQLLTATLDLQLVRLLRDAIRTADIESARTLPPANAANSSAAHCVDRFESRQGIHSTPRYEARPVIHPEPRIEVSTSNLPTQVESAPVPSHARPPVWKVPIWKSEPASQVQIKRIICKPDVRRRGTLIDLFL